MSLKRKAVEGIVVASSLAVMCSIAETAGMVVVEAAPVTVDAETDLEAKRTAGVILYLDLVEAEVLSSLEEAADIQHMPANMVSSAESAWLAGQGEAEKDAQPQGTDLSGVRNAESSVRVFAGASEVLAGISEQYSAEKSVTEDHSVEVFADGEEVRAKEDGAAAPEENSLAEESDTPEIAEMDSPEGDRTEQVSGMGVEGQETGDLSAKMQEEQPGQETTDAEGNSSEAADGAELQAVPEDDAAADSVENQPATESQEEWQNRLMADVNDFLYVRSEGSTEADIVGKMYKGDVAEIVEAGETWTHVVSGNVDGYVLNEYCVSGQQALEYASVNFDTQAEIQTNGLRVRSDADAESPVLTSVSTGTTLTVDTSVVTNDEWVAVKYEGATAYVSAEYVKTDLALGEAVTIEEERAAAAAAAKAAEEAAAKEAQKKQTQTVQKASVSASIDDVTLLAALIQCEAGSESYEGQLAVGAVVMNRVRSGAYPGSIYGVIYESGQFSPAGSGAVASVAANGPKGSCIQAAQQALGGADNTGGATSFRRASSGQPGIVIGNHVFF